MQSDEQPLSIEEKLSGLQKLLLKSTGQLNRLLKNPQTSQETIHDQLCEIKLIIEDELKTLGEQLRQKTEQITALAEIQKLENEIQQKKEEQLIYLRLLLKQKQILIQTNQKTETLQKEIQEIGFQIRELELRLPINERVKLLQILLQKKIQTPELQTEVQELTDEIKHLELTLKIQKHLQTIQSELRKQIQFVYNVCSPFLTKFFNDMDKQSISELSDRGPIRRLYIQFDTLKDLPPGELYVALNSFFNPIDEKFSDNFSTRKQNVHVGIDQNGKNRGSPQKLEYQNTSKSIWKNPHEESNIQDLHPYMEDFITGLNIYRELQHLLALSNMLLPLTKDEISEADRKRALRSCANYFFTNHPETCFQEYQEFVNAPSRYFIPVFEKINRSLGRLEQFSTNENSELSPCLFSLLNDVQLPYSLLNSAIQYCEAPDFIDAQHFKSLAEEGHQQLVVLLEEKITEDCKQFTLELCSVFSTESKVSTILEKLNKIKEKLEKTQALLFTHAIENRDLQKYIENIFNIDLKITTLINWLNKSDKSLVINALWPLQLSGINQETENALPVLLKLFPGNEDIQKLNDIQKSTKELHDRFEKTQNTCLLLTLPDIPTIKTPLPKPYNQACIYVTSDRSIYYLDKKNASIKCLGDTEKTPEGLSFKFNERLGSFATPSKEEMAENLEQQMKKQQSKLDLTKGNSEKTVTSKAQTEPKNQNELSMSSDSDSIAEKTGPNPKHDPTKRFMGVTQLFIEEINEKNPRLRSLELSESNLHLFLLAIDVQIDVKNAGKQNLHFFTLKKLFIEFKKLCSTYYYLDVKKRLLEIQTGTCKPNNIVSHFIKEHLALIEKNLQIITDFTQFVLDDYEQQIDCLSLDDIETTKGKLRELQKEITERTAGETFTHRSPLLPRKKTSPTSQRQSSIQGSPYIPTKKRQNEYIGRTPKQITSDSETTNEIIPDDNFARTSQSNLLSIETTPETKEPIIETNKPRRQIYIENSTTDRCTTQPPTITPKSDSIKRVTQSHGSSRVFKGSSSPTFHNQNNKLERIERKLLDLKAIIDAALTGLELLDSPEKKLEKTFSQRNLSFTSSTKDLKEKADSEKKSSTEKALTQSQGEDKVSVLGDPNLRLKESIPSEWSAKNLKTQIKILERMQRKRAEAKNPIIEREPSKGKNISIETISELNAPILELKIEKDPEKGLSQILPQEIKDSPSKVTSSVPQTDIKNEGNSAIIQEETSLKKLTLSEITSPRVSRLNESPKEKTLLSSDSMFIDQLIMSLKLKLNEITQSESALYSLTSSQESPSPSPTDRSEDSSQQNPFGADNLIRSNSQLTLGFSSRDSNSTTSPNPSPVQAKKQSPFENAKSDYLSIFSTKDFNSPQTLVDLINHVSSLISLATNQSEIIALFNESNGTLKDFIKFAKMRENGVFQSLVNADAAKAFDLLSKLAKNQILSLISSNCTDKAYQWNKTKANDPVYKFLNQQQITSLSIFNSSTTTSADILELFTGNLEKRATGNSDLKNEKIKIKKEVDEFVTSLQEKSSNTKSFF